MTIQEIKELLELFHSSGVAEMEVQRGDGRVRFSRGGGVSQAVAAPAALVAMPTSATVAVAAPASAEATPGKPAMADEGVIVKSPIVGTFYESPSPDAPPFVKVGDQVEKGQVLCIIESMKLMNEIEAEVAGTIVARLVENARPVEYGEPLFSVKPR
jgi:acetyl-CoA carboxylase biotin carboxyl carrier protein